MLRLRSENDELRGLLKEQKSSEYKEKESTDASGNSSEGQAELRKSLEALDTEDAKVTKLSKKKGGKKWNEISDRESPITNVSTADDEESPRTNCQPHSNSEKQHFAKHRVSFVLQKK